MSVFGHRVSEVWVLGRVLVAGAVESGAGLTVMDITDPANPVKKFTLSSSAGDVNGDGIDDSAERLYGLTMGGFKDSAGNLHLRIFAAGKDDGGAPGVNHLVVYEVDFDGNQVPNKIHKVKSSVLGCGEGGYIAVQDNYAHSGMSRCYEKYDIGSSAGSYPRAISRTLTDEDGSFTGGIITGSSNGTKNSLTADDQDFATPIGNLVFIGNDHEGSSAGNVLACHQAAADTTGPAVTFVSPLNNSTGVPPPCRSVSPSPISCAWTPSTAATSPFASTARARRWPRTTATG
jgi:hypothetical protein